MNIKAEQKQMNFEQWLDKYKPIQNHLDNNASIDGLMFETYDEEYAFVVGVDRNRVWTYINEDGEDFITKGLRVVNRLGYFITEEPHKEDADDVTLFEAE